jgi:hypothetical protein
VTPELLAAWLFAAMIKAVTPGKYLAPPENVETVDDARARYQEIAAAAAEVALDPDERSVFPGDDGRRRTAALLLSLSMYESGWKRDVDLGIGKHDKPVKASRQYWCIMQIGVDGKTTSEGWTGPDLVADRTRCFRAGLHRLQRARGYCRAQGPDAWLRMYTLGSCTRGEKGAEQRLASVRRWMGYPFPAPTPAPSRP